MTLSKEWADDRSWMGEFKKWIMNPSENTNYLVQVLKLFVMKNGRTDQSVADDQHIFSKAITLIDIGFDNLETKLTKESIADRASSLVSDLGGQLGLWLGISMVSLLEVISCVFFCIPKSLVNVQKRISKDWERAKRSDGGIH